MPFKATHRDAALIDAGPHMFGAANAERVAPAELSGLWSALAPEDRDGLVAYAKDPQSEGTDLIGWRAAFPGQFAELDDARASALIRVAVAVAGGSIVEDDGTITGPRGARP